VRPLAPLVPLLYRTRAFALKAAHPAVRLYRGRYRGVPTVHDRPVPGSHPALLEGYPDRLWYRAGDEAAFHLRSPFRANTLVVERVTGPDRFDLVATIDFERADQPVVSPDAAEHGCRWAETLRMPLDPTRFRTGYYRARIVAADAPEALSDASAITFLVQNDEDGRRNDVAVIAPVATWVAYNPHGHKSIYHNEFDGRSVYFVSALRPNPALSYHPTTFLHSMRTEASAFAWLDDAFGADLFPDYALETPDLFERYRLIVLLYHAEYVSHEAYHGLRSLVLEGDSSLLALGGNQLYWKIRWHDARTRIECRKDATPFSDGSGLGGLWRHTANPEDELLGVRFTEPGTGTYAPYRVLDADHWLFEGAGVERGQLFGLSGVTPYPICGDETDKPTPLTRLRTEVIARGLNRPDAVDGEYTAFPVAGRQRWNGSAGGAIAFTPLSERRAVLSTGSIHSASGLGADPVFTRLVENFVRRYAG
jgi:N,N-dimethylformamidase